MSGTALLEIRGLEVVFDGFRAIGGVDLTVEQGELRFLIGPNGAGKTTLIDVITGLTRPAAGTVRFAGTELTGRREHRIVRLGIGRTFQTSVVFEELTVVENLDLAAGFRRPLPTLLRQRRGIDGAVASALDTIGLGDLAGRPAGVLSHGQRQWLEIGMLIAQRPRLLLLDEPVAGMSGDECERRPPWLEAGLEAGYGRARLLFGVDVSVAPGALLCVMGRNGAGKTTLLNTVMGVLPPGAGTVVFDGADVTRLPTHERVRRGMGYVPQGHGTFPQLTVAENLQVTLEASRHRDRGAIGEALEVFPRLEGLLGRPAGFLSGGQQQQLAIARALVTRPRLLILDEPTEGIQPSIVAEIEAAIERLHRERGMAVLLVEQYLELAVRLADAFVIIESGAVRRTGTAADLRDEEVRRLLAV